MDEGETSAALPLIYPAGCPRILGFLRLSERTAGRINVSQTLVRYGIFGVPRCAITAAQFDLVPPQMVDCR